MGMFPISKKILLIMYVKLYMENWNTLKYLINLTYVTGTVYS